jgi:hypothetical protein
MSEKSKHIHKLKKHKYKNGTAVFFCTLPDCHYKLETPLALGKECLCNICDEPFLLNEYTIKLTKPHCNNCGKKEIKDASGKKRYIYKRGTKILSSIAQDNAEELRARLQGIVKPIIDSDI